jgi:hypothetical protein
VRDHIFGPQETSNDSAGSVLRYFVMSHVVPMDVSCGLRKRLVIVYGALRCSGRPVQVAFVLEMRNLGIDTQARSQDLAI